VKRVGFKLRVKERRVMEEQSAESGEPKEEEMVGEWIGELEVEELV